MELKYELTSKKAKDPVWNSNTKSYDVYLVIGGNDPFYKNQGMNWGAGVKTEWPLLVGEPYWFKTGLKIDSDYASDLVVGCTEGGVSLIDFRVSEDNELFVQLESEVSTNILRMNKPIVSIGRPSVVVSANLENGSEGEVEVNNSPLSFADESNGSYDYSDSSDPEEKDED